MSFEFQKGDMTFTSKHCKPTHMSMDEWMESDKPRKWVSKDGELPSEFIMRIMNDFEEGGAQVKWFIREELNKEAKK